MGAQKKIDHLSCEQLYNIWSSEPEVIKILDLREPALFALGHIPGAEPTDREQLEDRMKMYQKFLVVLIVDPTQNIENLEAISSFQNYVYLNQCHRWSELNFPLTGQNQKTFSCNWLQTGESMSSNDVIFQQLFEPESSTYTYIIADKMTKEAAIIDPVLETVDRDLALIQEMGLNLIYSLDTHIHADHITGSGHLRKRLGVKTAVSKTAQVGCADVALEDGQILRLGEKEIRVLATPGHTNTCLSFYFEGRVFTGDALLIRGCGRTDFQQGSSEQLYNSVHQKLFRLPDETIVYPGHDYRGLTSSTIALEKAFNPRLKSTVSMNDFTTTMKELKLADPKKIDTAVPANLACGAVQDSKTFHPQKVNGVPEITVDDLNSKLKSSERNFLMIDVRRPDEFNNELGHIEGAKLVTLGPELTQFLKSTDKTKEIVFICRSGGRSGTATLESIQLGYTSPVNMAGGMLLWNEKKLPTSKM